MKQPVTASSGIQQSAQHSRIKLSDLQSDKAHHHSNEGAQRGPPSMEDATDAASVDDNPAYLHMLASLAQEGELSSPGQSDSDEAEVPSGFLTAQDQHAAPSAAWHAERAGRGGVAYIGSHDMSLSHGDHRAVHDEESVGMPAADSHQHTQHSNSAVQMSASASLASDAPASRQEEEASPLAQALAALVAGAQPAPQQPVQTAQQAQHEPNQAAQHVERLEPGQQSLEAAAAVDDSDVEASLSSQSSGDLLANAAAAATAAGLFPTRHGQTGSADYAESAAAGSAASASQGPDVHVASVPQWSYVASQQAQQGPKHTKHAMFADQDDQGSSQQAQHDPKQAKHAMFADQDDDFESQQAQQGSWQSGSGAHMGPASSAPSWSGSAAGVGRFKDNQAINYVGKSARRPKVMPAVRMLIQPENPSSHLHRHSLLIVTPPHPCKRPAVSCSFHITPQGIANCALTGLFLQHKQIGG